MSINFKTYLNNTLQTHINSLNKYKSQTRELPLLYKQSAHIDNEEHI